MRYQALFFMLSLLLISCSFIETQPCTEGEWYNGTMCCSDMNSDGVCDVEEQIPEKIIPQKTPVKGITSTPEDIIIRQPLEPSERQALIEAFVEKTVSLWQQDRWQELYQLLPLDERLQISEKVFSRLMPIYDFDTRSVHSPQFAYIQKNPHFNPFGGSLITLVSVTLDGDTATALANITYGGIHAGNFVFAFEWIDEWHLKNPLPDNNPENFCNALDYTPFCYYELAKAFSEPDYCEQSDMYFIDCYEVLKQEVPIDVAVSICSAQGTRSVADMCLNDAVVATQDVILCDKIIVKINAYECRGIIAGFEGELDQCFEAITTTKKNERIIYEDRCAYGYARATGERSACEKINNDVDEALRKDCLRMVS